MFDAVVGLSDLIGGGLPDVDDAGRDLQRLGGAKDWFDERQVGVGRASGPYGAVPHLLDLDRLVGHHRAAPHAETA